MNSIKTCGKWVLSRNWTSTTVQTKRASFVFTLRTEKQYESMLQNLSSFRLLRSASHKLFIQQLFSFLSVLKKDYHFKLLLFLNWKVTDTDVFVDKLPNTNGTWLYEIIRIINVNFFPMVIMMLQLTSYKFCRLISIRFFNELVERIWKKIKPFPFGHNLFSLGENWCWSLLGRKRVKR